MKYTVVNKDEWAKSSSMIFYGIIGIVCFGIICFAFMMTQGIAAAVDAASESAAAKDPAVSVKAVAIIFYLAYVASYVTMIIGAGKLSEIQIMEDALLGVKRIRTVFILDLTAIILPFLAMLIPGVAALSVLFILASAVLSVVALIMLREACKDLETERSWSTAAKRGAAQLKKSASYCLYMIVAPIPMALVLLIAAWIVAAAKDLNIYKLAYDVISGNFDAGYAFPLILALIFAFIELFWAVMQFVYKIMGWYNIKNGYMMNPVKEQENRRKRSDEVSDLKDSALRYCIHCGAALPLSSRFCSSCGKEVTSIEDASAVPGIKSNASEVCENAEDIEGDVSSEEVRAVDFESEFDEKAEKRKKWIMIGCGVGVLVAIIIVILICRKSSEQDTLFEERLQQIVESSGSTSEENGAEGSSSAEEGYNSSGRDNNAEEDFEFETPTREIEIVNPIEGAMAFVGKLDGKYEIVLQIVNPYDSDGKVWGSYYYTKYKAPIDLKGEFADGVYTLEEYTDGNLTGKFVGRIYQTGFDGIWESADGETTRDCTLYNIK